MNHFTSRILLSALLVAFGAGCQTGTPEDAAEAPVAPSPTVPAPGAPATAAAAILSADRAGPVALGMTREEVEQLTGVETHVLAERQLEGMPAPAVQVREGDEELLLAELEDDAVFRIVVLSPRFRTSAGAGVGSSVSELGAIYGAGQVLEGEGETYALFRDTAPGLSFGFGTVMVGGSLIRPDWEHLVRENPSVQRILVVGTDLP
jgi:hypothetical protein